MKASAARSRRRSWMGSPPTPSPRARAIREFERCREATKAGLSLALKSGKFAYLEAYFRHMLSLMDKFALDGVDTADFLDDYAELLSRTNHADEAAKLRARANRGRSG